MSMRQIPLCLALVVLATAASPVLALECDAGFRPFVHAAGEDCIPLDPKRIVTLQDQNGLLPLLELGVTPVASVGHINEEGAQIYRRTEGFDTSAVVFVGTYGEPDREAVLAQNPDLIIGAALSEETYKAYSAIAPTISIDMFANDLEVALYQFADAVNRVDRAKELEAEVLARANAIRAQLADQLGQTTISVVTREYQGAGFLGFAPSQAFGSIRRILQPVMTPPEASWEPSYDAKSLELVSEHAADLMFFLTFDADGSLSSCASGNAIHD